MMRDVLHNQRHHSPRALAKSQMLWSRDSCANKQTLVTPPVHTTTKSYQELSLQQNSSAADSAEGARIVPPLARFATSPRALNKA